MNKKRVGKIILIVLGSLLGLILLLALGLLIYANIMLNKLDRTEITGNIHLSEDEVYEGPTEDVPDSEEEKLEAHQQSEETQKIPILQEDEITNILFVGSDRRNKNENGRSDSMMLVSLNYKTGKIHITSLMRAMYVCIPRSDGNIWGMLNAAYSWGGPNLLIDTVELNFRVKIHHYVVVDISAFQEAVDLVGGVEINLTETEARYVRSDSGYETPAGKQLLNGAQARAYCQIRYIDNDFVRTGRQRIVIKELIKKAAGSDLGTLINLANQILPLVNTNLTNNEILSYMMKSLPLLGNVSQGRMLPVENESGKTYTGMIYVGGREMYKVDFEANIKALHEYIQS